MQVLENLKYSEDHEWVKVDDTIATIGITDFAQSELGDIVFVDVESDLEAVTNGETFGAIEAVKTVSDLLSPCSGKVIEVNGKLEDEPQLINTDPFGEGWIIKVEMINPDELNNLMDTGAYKNLTSE